MTTNLDNRKNYFDIKFHRVKVDDEYSDTLFISPHPNTLYIIMKDNTGKDDFIVEEINHIRNIKYDEMNPNILKITVAGDFGILGFNFNYNNPDIYNVILPMMLTDEPVKTEDDTEKEKPKEEETKKEEFIDTKSVEERMHEKLRSSRSFKSRATDTWNK